MGRSGHLMIFCSALQAGGAERVLSILSQPFADHYEQVTYLMWHDAPVFYQIDDRVRLVSVERACRGGGMLRRLLWMRRYVRQERPDLLLSFSAPFNMLALTALLGSRQRIVVAERIDPRSFRWGYGLNILRTWLYHTADGILAQTPSSKAYFKTLQRKTAVIYNPVVMPDQLVGRALTEAKQPVIVSAARLVKQKQQTVLIRAFAKFYKNHPTYRLIIYGKGPELERLQHDAEMMGVGHAVLFPGVVKEIWTAMLSAQMFVMSSQFEGMSNSLIEAMCLGLPCISTNVSGAVDLIRHGENGFLVDVGDDEAISRCMEQLVADPVRSRQIGEQAATLYEALNVTCIARQWLDYLDGMMLR